MNLNKSEYSRLYKAFMLTIRELPNQTIIIVELPEVNTKPTRRFRFDLSSLHTESNDISIDRFTVLAHVVFHFGNEVTYATR